MLQQIHSDPQTWPRKQNRVTASHKYKLPSSKIEPSSKIKMSILTRHAGADYKGPWFCVGPQMLRKMCFSLP